jgi:hypothetical protein
MLIYIVTTGTYSEYSIHKVFTDEDAANKHSDFLNRNRYEGYASVETWNTDTPPSFIAYYVSLDFPRVYNARMIARGYDFSVEPSLTRHDNIKQIVDILPATHVRAHAERPDVFIGGGYGKSFEEAEKNLYDAIAKAKAEYLEL